MTHGVVLMVRVEWRRCECVARWCWSSWWRRSRLEWLQQDAYWHRCTKHGDERQPGGAVDTGLNWGTGGGFHIGDRAGIVAAKSACIAEAKTQFSLAINDSEMAHARLILLKKMS